MIEILRRKSQILLLNNDKSISKIMHEKLKKPPVNKTFCFHEKSSGTAKNTPGESSELSEVTVVPSRDSMHPKGESKEPLSTLIPHMLLSYFLALRLRNGPEHQHMPAPNITDTHRRAQEHKPIKELEVTKYY